MNLENLRLAQVDDQLSFTYNSGSNYGRTRNVVVTEVHHYGSTDNLGWIKGKDLDDVNNQSKNFSAAYAVDIEKVVVAHKTVNRLTFPEVQRQITAKMKDISSEGLALLYAELVVDNEEANVEFDEETGEVVVSEPATEPHFESGGSLTQFYVVNKQNERLVVDICDDCVTVDDCVVTPQELADELLYHIDGGE